MVLDFLLRFRLVCVGGLLRIGMERSGSFKIKSTGPHAQLEAVQVAPCAASSYACIKIQFLTRFRFYSIDQSQVLTLHTNLKVFPNSILDA